MIIQFKAKEKGGTIIRPELKPKHVVKGGPFNELTLNMALRRIYRNNPELKIGKVIYLDDLPYFVSAERSGFLTVITIDLSAAH